MKLTCRRSLMIAMVQEVSGAVADMCVARIMR